jgi:hypothetical protein
LSYKIQQSPDRDFKSRLSFILIPGIKHTKLSKAHGSLGNLKDAVIIMENAARGRFPCNEASLLLELE